MILGRNAYMHRTRKPILLPLLMWWTAEYIYFFCTKWQAIAVIISFEWNDPLQLFSDKIQSKRYIFNGNEEC